MHSIKSAGETLEILCGEKLKILQRKDAYRFSIDAFLLANFAVLKAGERMLDIGSGCGIIPIYMAKCGYTNHMTGVEIQEELFSLAEKNKALNGITDNNVRFIHDNIENYMEQIDKPFNVVISNPPYTKENTGRQCPERSRFIARHESHLDLSGLVRSAARALNKKGRFSVIYPARRLGEAVCVSQEHRLTLKRLRMVHPRQGEKANLFLAEFMKEGGIGVTVENPLYIYENRTLSAEVQKYYTIEG